VIAIFSGVLLVLIHPGFRLTFLAPFALIPLFYSALHGKRRFLYGWLTGIVYWAGACSWIETTLEQHGGMGSAESVAVFILFCLAKALQTGVFAWAVSVVLTHVVPTHGRHATNWFTAPALAALWTVLEWTHNYTGFAWLVLGNAATDWPFLAKLAPYTGVWGISFALALISAILVTRQWQWLALFAVLLFLPALPPEIAAPLTVRAVQPNISEDASWSEQSIAALQQHLTDLSHSATPPTLIIWPEVPAPIYDQDRFLPGVPRAEHTPLLAGVVSHTDHGAPLNSALLLSPEGRFISRYDKINLVPFGEFVPWPLGVIAHKISTEAGDFSPGDTPVVADGIGTFICYESVFPNYIRQFSLRGARALFNISNDSWFAKSAARDQHFLIVRMRAMENRRWIVRVTNNGITASIDPAGRVLDLQPSYQEVSATLHYAEEQSLTLYTRWGDWFVYVCLVGLLLLALMAANVEIHWV